MPDRATAGQEEIKGGGGEVVPSAQPVEELHDIYKFFKEHERKLDAAAQWNQAHAAWRGSISNALTLKNLEHQISRGQKCWQNWLAKEDMRPLGIMILRLTSPLLQAIQNILLSRSSLALEIKCFDASRLLALPVEGAQNLPSICARLWGAWQACV